NVTPHSCPTRRSSDLGAPNGIWGVDGYLYMTFTSNPGSIALGRVNLDTQQFEWLFNVQSPCRCFSPGGLWFDGRDAFYFVERTRSEGQTLEFSYGWEL